MKKTVDINLGGLAFTIDEDAYLQLKEYLDDIASRLPKEDAEIINDVESRLAEIFQNHAPDRHQVISKEMTRQAMSVMGQPEEFGEKKHIDELKENRKTAQTSRKLYRNGSDRWIAGICSGIAAYFNIDTSVVRIVTLVLILFGGLSIWIYIILWIVIPKAFLQPDGTIIYPRK